MTIPNLQIHETDFQPETAEYWEISLGAATPFWATPEASELDLYSISEYRLTKRLICIISSIGIKMSPEHPGLIREHSSLALKGVYVYWGVIDPDCQGEIWVILQKEKKDDLFINRHDLLLFSH